MLVLIHTAYYRIQRLQNFNTSHVSVNLANGFLKSLSASDFNTSHVSVNQLTELTLLNQNRYFNTSHVSVNLVLLHHQRNHYLHFNTSHVSVNPASWYLDEYCKPISIHLMLVLICKKYVFLNNINHFNTSHVSVNHSLNNFSLSNDLFQYISC